MSNLLTCILHTLLALSDGSTCAILHKVKPQSMAEGTVKILSLYAPTCSALTALIYLSQLFRELCHPTRMIIVIVK